MPNKINTRKHSYHKGKRAALLPLHVGLPKMQSIG